MGGPISMKRQNVNEKAKRPPYLKILRETISERFNLPDLSTDFFDPWHEDDAYASFVRRCSNLKKSTKARSGAGIWRRLA